MKSDDTTRCDDSGADDRRSRMTLREGLIQIRILGKFREKFSFRAEALHDFLPDVVLF